MVYFPNEACSQQLRDLIADGPTFPLVEAAQALLHRLGAWHDLQGMFGDFSWNARHVRGFPRKDVFVGAEKVDEHAFLFRGKCGANVHHLALGATESMRTSLEPSSGSKDRIDLLGLGASSVTSFLMAMSSQEATIATA